MSKRLTRQDFEEMQTLGALNPVGHALLAFESDEKAREAQRALEEAGFAEDDILLFTSGQLFPNLTDMMRNASGAAGFGYEILLMRRYMTLASEGAGWVAVYSPEDEQTGQVQEVAKRLGAKSAVQYGRLLHEDLI